MRTFGTSRCAHHRGRDLIGEGARSRRRQRTSSPPRPWSLRPLVARNAASAPACRAGWQEYFGTHDVSSRRPRSPRHFTITASPLAIADRYAGGNSRTRQDRADWRGLTRGPACDRGAGRAHGRGLPVGLRIIAPMWEDGTSIEFAACCQTWSEDSRLRPDFRSRCRWETKRAPRPIRC